jgi:hypothetical protein
MRSLANRFKAPRLDGRPIRVEISLGFSTGYFTRLDAVAMTREEVVNQFSKFSTSNIWPPSQTELAVYHLMVGWFVEFETHSQFIKALKVRWHLKSSSLLS